MSRTTRRLLAAAFSVTALSSAASAAVIKRPAQVPRLQIVHVETDDFYGELTTPGGTVLYARTAALQDGGDDGWWLRMDVRVQNVGVAPLTIVGFELDTDASSPDYTPLETPVVVDPGKQKTLIPQDLRGVGALPGVVGIRVYADGYADPVVRVDSVAEFIADTPTGGYPFPARAEDLPDGIFWGVGKFHAHDLSQRYAYDFRNWRRTDAGDWDYLTAEAYADPEAAPGDRDDHFLIFGRPVYAMADGIIVRCRRTEPDLDPTEEGSDGPNYLFVDHGNGEFALYAHFQADSIPPELCPEEAPADGVNPAHVPVAILQGQPIGNVGSSGTGTPHLHVHLQDSHTDLVGKSNVRGLPLQFHGTDVHAREGFDPVADADTWYRIPASQPAAFSVEHLAMPNPCGLERYAPGEPEVVRTHIPAACYQVVFDAVVAAGYRPVYVDGFLEDGALFYNAVWQPTAGVTWAAAHGLDAAAWQATVDARELEGFRPVHVESYPVGGGAIRYAGVFAKLPGRWVAYHGLDYPTHKANLDGLALQGYQPVSLSVASDGVERRYTALYLKEAGGFVVRSQIREADYQAVYGEQRAAGRYLRSLQAYEHGGDRYFAAVFSTSVSEPWAQHGLSGADWLAAWLGHLAAGRLTRLVTGYDVGGQATYAAAWAP